jgi:hypothetical protein
MIDLKKFLRGFVKKPSTLTVLKEAAKLISTIFINFINKLECLFLMPLTA